MRIDFTLCCLFINYIVGAKAFVKTKADGTILPFFLYVKASAFCRVSTKKNKKVPSEQR